MFDEWFMVALILATPVVLFAVLELMGIARGRRERALAQRNKGSGRL